jgi:hypothetical protein
MYAEISQELFNIAQEGSRMQQYVLNLPLDGEDKYIFCVNENTNGFNRGNYVQCAPDEASANVKLSWGETKRFKRAIFLETIKPIEKNQDILLSNQCRSHLYFPNFTKGNSGLTLESQNDPDTKKGFLTFFWHRLFEFDESNLVRVNPHHYATNFETVYDLIQYFANREEVVDIGELQQKMKIDILFNVYCDDLSRQCYKNTKPSGLCYGIAPYQAYCNIIGFEHDDEHLDDFVEYMQEYVNGLKDYLLPAKDNLSTFSTVQEEIQTMEYNIMKAKQGATGKFVYGNMDMFFIAAKHIFNRDISRGRHISILYREDEERERMFGYKGDFQYPIQCNGQFKIANDSKCGFIQGSLYEKWRFMLADTNIVAYDGSHYYNVWVYKEMNMLQLFEEAFAKCVERFKTVIEEIRKLYADS